MTLLDMKPGQTGQIISINKGSQGARRLFEMGLVPGAKVTLLSRHPFSGPLVLLIGNSKVALGRGIADAVEIKNIGKSS